MSKYTEAHRRWYLKNRERLLEERRAYAAQYTAAHPEKIAEYRERTAEERRMKDSERYWRKKAERVALALAPPAPPVSPCMPPPAPLDPPA
jgi:hypothetical protein